MLEVWPGHGLGKTCDRDSIGNSFQDTEFHECRTANVEKTQSHPKRIYASGAEKKKQAKFAGLQRASQCPKQTKLSFFRASKNFDPQYTNNQVPKPDDSGPETPTSNDSPAKEKEIQLLCYEENRKRTAKTPQDIVGDDNSTPMTSKSKGEEDSNITSTDANEKSQTKRTDTSGAEEKKKKKAKLSEVQMASQCLQQSKLPFFTFNAHTHIDVEVQDHIVKPHRDPSSETITAKGIERVSCEENRTEGTPQDIFDNNLTPMAAEADEGSDITSGGIEERVATEQNLTQPHLCLAPEQMESQEMSCGIEKLPQSNEHSDIGSESICNRTANTSLEVVADIDTCEIADPVGDPFDELFLNHSDLNEEEKKRLIRVHPVQPQTKPSEPVKLPFDKERIYFQRAGGDPRLWISYSHVRQKLFCWICRAFGKTTATSTLSSFVTGWGNEALWKKGASYRAADLHECSEEHKDAIEAYFTFANDKSIHILSNINVYTQRKKQVTQRREIVLRVINIILFLGRQGIAFRGSGNEAAYSIPDTSNHGNFLELVKCQAVFDPVLSAYVDRVVKESQDRHEKHPKSRGRGDLTTMLSKSTLISLLKVIGDMVQRYIVQQVTNNGGKYSLCIDSTQDISVKEQTSIVVRYVDEYGPMERLLDVVETPETTGQALHDHTVAVLSSLGLSLVGGLLGYSFDGASNMSGRLKGLQALLKATVPGSVYQHCYAHVLQLVIEKCCSCVPEAVTFFDLLRESPVMVSESHKRMQLWKDIVFIAFPQERSSSNKFMVKLSKTRWWSKCKALKRILTADNSILPIIIVVLLLLSEDPEISAPIRAKARGSVLSWCSFETLAVGMVFSKIFSLTESVSQYLQDKNLDHLQAARMTSSLIASVATIDVESALTEARAVAVSCNEVIEKLNASDAFVERFGEVDVRVSTEAVRRRVPVVPKRSGEVAGDDLRRSLESQPPNNYLRIRALIPIHDRCLSELKARFEGDSEATFKACSFLNPGWFDDILKKGIPRGALRSLCCLADVDEIEAETQLMEYAKNFKKLIKTIQADFRPGPKEYDLDGDSDDGNSDDDDDVCESEGVTVENSVKVRANENIDSPQCISERECEGCLRCSYRLLKKHGLHSKAYQAVWKLYKCALTLPCTQVTCERCFSKLKIIKNRLRNSMSQENLRSAILMSVERDITFMLDPVEILETFAKTSSERSKLLLY